MHRVNRPEYNTLATAKSRKSFNINFFGLKFPRSTIQVLKKNEAEPGEASAGCIQIMCDSLQGRKDPHLSLPPSHSMTP